MDTHPHAWLAALGRALQRAVLEPDEAGGLGLVHTSVPIADVDRFRLEEVDSVVDMVRTTAEAEVAAVLKQVGANAVDHLVALRRARSTWPRWPRRLGGGGHPAAAGFTREGTVEREVLRRAAAAPRLAAGTAGRLAYLVDPLVERPEARMRCAPSHGGSRDARSTSAEPTPSARRAFLAAALRRPGTVGAVVPSSTRLAEVLAAVVPRAGAPVVVELGPGTGAVSAVIRRRLPAAGPPPRRRARPGDGRLPAPHPPGARGRAGRRRAPGPAARRARRRAGSTRWSAGCPGRCSTTPTQAAILAEVAR